MSQSSEGSGSGSALSLPQIASETKSLGDITLTLWLPVFPSAPGPEWSAANMGGKVDGRACPTIPLGPLTPPTVR